MTKRNSEDLHHIMAMAWAFHTGRPADEPRPFSASLVAAWRMHRGLRECAAKLQGVRYLQLSNSLIRSPMSRVWAGDPINESGAAYVSAMFGQ